MTHHRPLQLLSMILFILSASPYAMAQRPTPDGEVKDYYDDGKLRSVEHYKDGVLQGAAQHYYPDGKIEAEAVFERGQVRSQKTYFENGQLEAEGSLDENGLTHGTLTHYMKDGVQLVQSQYIHGRYIGQDGQPFSGARVINFPNGQVYAEGSYVDGYLQGIHKEYYPSSRLKEEAMYVDGKLNGLAIEYYESGQARLKQTYKDNILDGPSVSYYESGQESSLITYKAGAVDGILKSYYDNGQLSSSSQHRDGKLEGRVLGFYEDGKPQTEGAFVNDVPRGEFREYYPNGQVKAVVVYDDKGNPVETKEYDEQGKPRESGVRFDTERNKIVYGFLWLVAFIISLTVHEAAHAWSAYKLGDDTAYRGGQVSLNPLPHIKREVVGTIVVPILSFIANGWMIGWASAPYNPQWALQYPRRAALMSIAGPVSNLIMVILCFVLLKIGMMLHWFVTPPAVNFAQMVMASHDGFMPAVAAFLSIMFTLNLIMCVFNLIPVPPLDGSGVVPFFLSANTARAYMTLINHPTLLFVGLFVAWKSFDYIFDPIFLIAIKLMHPGVEWGA